MSNELIMWIVVAVSAVVIFLLRKYLNTLTPEKIAFISKAVGYISGATAKNLIKNEAVKGSIFKAFKSIKEFTPENGKPLKENLETALRKSLDGIQFEPNDKLMVDLVLDSLIKGVDFLVTKKFSDITNDVSSYIIISNAFFTGVLFAFEDTVLVKAEEMFENEEYLNILEEYNDYCS